MDRSGKARVLIAGGGVAALEAALALRALAADEVSVEVLAPDPRFWYRPAAVAAPFGAGEVRHFELDGLMREIGATFAPGALVAVDEWRHLAHTSLDTDIEYDKLIVACGAVPTPAIPGALTFRGPADIEKIEQLLAETEHGRGRSVVFAIPWGAAWSLPAYELALLTASRLEEQRVRDATLRLVTPEAEPLQLFGPEASKAVRELLDGHGIELHAGVYASEFAEGALRLGGDGQVLADRVVALPRLRGTPVDGLPQTVDGFVPVDAHCRVHGITDVFAAGDITSFTVKQGGIATQQADVAAEAIAADAGAPVTPTRFTPILRGVLLTGGAPRYLRRELSGRPEQEPVVSVEPLWRPPAKIVGCYLAPFLASQAGSETPPPLEAAPGVVAVEIELDPDAVRRQAWARPPLEDVEGETEETVASLMASELILVAPEDTLGETAEKLLDGDATAAAVCEFGALIGILTTADLVRACGGRAHPSEARARQWMTAEPVTARPATPVAAAARLMQEYRIRHLLVVDGDRPVGVVRLDSGALDATIPLGQGF
jgi:sulfide:quinone oxidoreductase